MVVLAGGDQNPSFLAMIDPLENNLFDLPDYENTEDERFPPLPPPASPGAAGADWAEAGGGRRAPGASGVETGVVLELAA